MTTQARRTRNTATAAVRAGDQAGDETVLSKNEFERVADFRYSLRRLLRQTELEAAKLDITPQHYQLMLTVKGFPGRDWANITELAERLQVRHNAVIGLVNRAEARGLLERRHDQTPGDRRVVQVHLTPEGEAVLRRLTWVLRSERERVSAQIVELTRDVVPDSHRSPGSLPDH
jgi:DNA-binding MarR family transcriptional regulator